AVAHHIGSATSGGQSSDFARYHGHRNLVWTYVKNMPGILFWLFLPLHCAFNLVTLLLFSLMGQGRVVFRAKADALRALPKMWRKRKVVQKQRVVSLAEILRMMDKYPLPRPRDRFPTHT
nr:glycosyltransferase family 2 protein [Desulfobacterales bacterium]